MPDNINQVQQRARQYWFSDGLAEISAGLVGLLLAGLFLAWDRLVLSRWGFFIVFGLGLVFAFGLRLLIQKIKERSTYQQTGYAAPLTGLEDRRAVAALVVFVLLLLAANFFLSRQGSSTGPLTTGLGGLVFAFLFAWSGYVSALRRLYLPALLSLVAGIGLALAQVSLFPGLASLCALNGLELLGQGLWARRAYLRQNLGSAG